MQCICYIITIELHRGSTSLNFVDTIKSIRRKSLRSQSDFAQTLGVSFSTVSRWKNGKSVPQFCKLKLINEFCSDRNIPFDVEKFISDYESSTAGTE